MPADDPDSTLDTAEDYTDYLPAQYRTHATAMRYATAWNMTMDDVLNMDWLEYSRRCMIYKAVTLRKPEFNKQQWFMMNTSSKYKAVPMSKRKRATEAWTKQQNAKRGR